MKNSRLSPVLLFTFTRFRKKRNESETYSLSLFPWDLSSISFVFLFWVSSTLFVRIKAHFSYCQTPWSRKVWTFADHLFVIFFNRTTAKEPPRKVNAVNIMYHSKEWEETLYFCPEFRLIFCRRWEKMITSLNVDFRRANGWQTDQTKVIQCTELVGHHRYLWYVREKSYPSNWAEIFLKTFPIFWVPGSQMSPDEIFFLIPNHSRFQSLSYVNPPVKQSWWFISR